MSSAPASSSSTSKGSLIGYLQARGVDPAVLELIRGYYAEKRTVQHKKLDPTNDAIGNFTLNFGKYSGKTIREICEIDSPYLYWLSSSDLSKRPDLAECLDALLHFNNVQV